MALAVELVVDPGLAPRVSNALGQLLTFAGQREASVPTGEWTLTVRLTEDASIAALHQRFFDDPAPTDVITFPSGDDLSASAGHLGDIVISVETAAAQAVDAGQAVEREIAFLALHGLLHLGGYDDDTKDARQAMLARQEQLLLAFEQQHGRSW